jgi:hypothetical protein
MRAWIFQANPKIYDVKRATQSLREDTWLVQQHRTEIHHGDRVYLWESGRDAGILAAGQVLDEVSEREMFKESKPFVLDTRKLGGVQPRVRISIDTVVDNKIKRSFIRKLAGLENLSILRQPRGTNFPVSPEESTIIEQLLAR